MRNAAGPKETKCANANFRQQACLAAAKGAFIGKMYMNELVLIY